jgi:hypothetical protein
MMAPQRARPYLPDRAHRPDYGRLTVYLKRRRRQRITLTFTHLEQVILLGMLPWGARRQDSWWSNTAMTQRPQHHAWLDAGWRVEACDRVSEIVTFERGIPSPPTSAPRFNASEHVGGTVTRL